MNLCRGKSPIELSDLTIELAARSHRIVLSMETLIELAAPLRNNLILEVRRDLNRLEALPLVFVNEARIYDMELREAVEAFEQGREYKFAAITPFTSRLADAIDIHGVPLYIIEYGRRVPTTMIVNFRMWEAIDYVWKHEPQALDVQRRREQEWLWVVDSDRSMMNPPSLRDHFATMMLRTLATHRIPPPAQGVEPFARWVYESPSRCPGIRLVYEAQHRFRRDLGARPSASDIIDLARVTSVP